MGGCPKCGSDQLMIRQPTGIERLRIVLTSTRKYRCRDCDHVFRAPDRRKAPRTSAEGAQKTSV